MLPVFVVGMPTAQKAHTELVYSIAARAGGNLPSDLPQAPALVSATQAEPESMKKKRKRTVQDDKQALQQGTGQPN